MNQNRLSVSRRNIFLLVLILPLCMAALPAHAQQETVQGTVISPDEQPVADEKATERNRQIVTLDGTQRRERVTGAYSQINFSEVAEIPIVNNVHKLTGQLSGLLIFQSDGEPGVEAARALIRGQRTLNSNNPVVLIDGFERDMTLLDPDEIETITILKDASATAQYGIRGGNGIISVTTKRGQVGKIKVTLSASGGFKQDIIRPKFLDSYNYATLYNEAMLNDGGAVRYGDGILGKYRMASAGNYASDMDRYLYPNINWYDEYINKSTWQQRYNITASGGTGFAKYFVALGYLNNEGVFNVDKDANTYKTNANMNMFTLRSNLDIQATRRMLVSVNFSGRQEQRRTPGNDDGYASRIFQALYRTPPNAFPVFNPDGSLGGSSDYRNNPYGLLNRSGYSLDFIRSLDADLTVKHDLDFITPGLRVAGTFAFDTWFEQVTWRDKEFAVYKMATTEEPDGTLVPALDADDQLQYSPSGTDTAMGEYDNYGEYPGSLRTMAWKVNLDYSRDFGKHSVYGFLGYNQRTIYQENNSNLPRQYLNLNGRISYGYDDRYLLDLVAGYEGSEQFPKGNRFGFFPAVSAGWVISNESFMPKGGFLNFLKIRASYGLTGLDDIGGGYFLMYDRYNADGTAQFGWSLPVSTSVRFPVWSAGNPAEPTVTWARIAKANIGLDATLLAGRIDLSLDLFTEKSRDISTAPFAPAILGTTLYAKPIGKMENRGLDLSLSYADKFGPVGFRVSGVYTTYLDNVIENGEIKPQYDYQSRKNRPLNQAWGLQALGYFTQADLDNPDTPAQNFGNNPVTVGDIKYKDQNNDGQIDNNDQIYLGRQANNNQAGLELELTWKGFDLSVLFTGQWGGSMAMNNEAAYEFYQNGGVLEHHLNRFNPRDPDSYVSHGMKFYKGDYPRLSINNAENNHQGSDFWRVSTNLMRLKTVELGYTFNPALIGKIGLSGLRLYVNAYNLATWSATDLVDVEANSGSGIVYPVQSIVSFGARISF